MVKYKKIYKLVCNRCGKVYELELTENAFNKGKYKRFCSRKCANTRTHSVETKQKNRQCCKKI